MLKKRFEISMGYFKNQNEKILLIRNNLEEIKKRKSDLNRQYSRCLNDYFLEYIEYRELIKSNFKTNLDQILNSQVICYQSNVLEEKEPNFWQVI